jgi:hypothetical protein
VTAAERLRREERDRELEREERAAALGRLQDRRLEAWRLQCARDADDAREARGE